MAGNFRYTVWDPCMILAQMGTLQCCFYVSLGFWIVILDVLAGYPRSLDQIFKYQSLFMSQSHGKLMITAVICNAFSSSLALWHVVQRTKLCLDYTCTVHFFHVLLCWYYNGFLANNFSWWVINTISVTIMCVSGEFLCMRTELKAIPVSMSAKVDL